MLDIDIQKIRKATNIEDESTTPIGNEVSDSTIEDYISDAQYKLEGMLGFSVEDKTVTETYDGDDSRQLLLHNYPITNVSSLKINDTDVSISNIHVYKTEGMIKLSDNYSGYFVEGNLNVEITYTYSKTDNETVNIAKEAIFHMVVIDVLMDVGSYYAEGAQKEKFDEYTLDYGSDGPYSGIITQHQKQLEDCVKTIGRKVDFKII